MNPVIYMLMGCLGTLGYNILFNIRGVKLALATLGGLLCCMVFFALEPLFPGESIRYCLTAAVVTAYGEILARVQKTPTTTFLVPSIVPLIPGSALYYTMNYALNEQWSEFGQQAFYTLQLTFALAAGIIAMTTVVRLISVLIRKRKKAEKGSLFHHSIR